MKLAISVLTATALMVTMGCGGSSSAGSKKVTPKPSSPQRTHAKGAGAEVMSLLAGIPQRGNVLGAPKAPVTLQYFGDLECPFCKKFTLGALPSLIQTYVRGGKLKIEYRSLQTATRDPETFKIQQVAALAAGKQKRMWEYIVLFYHEQGKENSGYVTERYIQELAQQVTGLNLIAWTVARGNAELANTITGDAHAANQAGLTATPSFLIGNTGGTFRKLRFTSLTNPSRYASAIEKLLKGNVATRFARPA